MLPRTALPRTALPHTALPHTAPPHSTPSLSRLARRAPAVAAVAAVLAVAAGSAAPAAAEPPSPGISVASAAGAAYSAPLRTAVSDLPTAAEVRTGYDRDQFEHWVDADGDGCDSRAEVLIEEADDPVSVGSGCSLSGGRWFSYYDRVSWTDPSDVDIDHLVPLAEAWDSGARSWSATERRSYANDLGDPRSLVGVTDSVNQAKGDQDPAEWMPQYDACRYVREWVAVKHRWGLSVDSGERSALTSLAGGCENVTITVTPAR